MKTAFVAAVIIYSANFCKAWDWCSKDAECEIDGKRYQNTMCTMKQSPVNDIYKDIKEATSDTYRQKYLSWHNTYRDKMANGEIAGWPKASNMRQMTWDKDLETVALRFSFQTRPGHDKCRRTEKYKDVGQNCGTNLNYPVGRPFPDDVGAFKGWVNEIVLVTPAKVVDKIQFDASWGHFTAVIWADTYKIGCATTTFLPKVNVSNPSANKDFQGRQDTCNMYPHGNVKDQPTYKRGEPCTACPAGTACNKESTHPHLCALPGDPANEKVEYIAKGVMTTVDYFLPPLLILLIVSF